MPSNHRFRLALIGLASALLAIESRGATLLYQWDFDAGTGVPAVGAGGGTLTANGTAGFAATGVSGVAGDNALSVSNSYSGGTGTGNSATTSVANVMTGAGTLSSFTVTMWVNLTAGDFTNFPRLFMAGTTSSWDNSPVGTPANGIFMSMNGGQLQYGVNGFTATQTVPLLNVGAAGTWVFLALSYDGTSTTPYNSTPNNVAYGSFNNAVLLTGNTSTSVAASNNTGLNTGGPTFGITPGAVTLGSSAYAFLGNRSNGARGLTGTMDDVRIYTGQLTVSELEAVRLDAITVVPEPGAACLALLGGLGLLRRKRK